MINLKTAELFSAALNIGAILAGCDLAFSSRLAEIGASLGLGFQIQDDYLGIWGNSDKTGKSVSTDLLTRKKTFPAMQGLANSEDFRFLWDRIDENEVEHIEEMKDFLERIEIHKDTLNLARAYYIDAQTELNELLPTENKASQAMLSLVTSMFAPVLAEA
jgi:geranylgeranyl pyrophosphate synthase